MTSIPGHIQDSYFFPTAVVEEDAVQDLAEQAARHFDAVTAMLKDGASRTQVDINLCRCYVFLSRAVPCVDRHDYGRSNQGSRILAQFLGSKWSAERFDFIADLLRSYISTGYVSLSAPLDDTVPRRSSHLSVRAACALEYTVRCGNSRLMQVLLDAGADASTVRAKRVNEQCDDSASVPGGAFIDFIRQQTHAEAEAMLALATRHVMNLRIDSVAVHAGAPEPALLSRTRNRRSGL